MPHAPSPEARVLSNLLESAGRAALQRFGTVEARLKSDGTEVTEADLAASAILVEGLASAFPGCAVVSEEGEEIAGSGATWYVDPIDGTAAFLEGLPTWGPTVCLVADGALNLGALHLPRVHEHWFAEHNGGAWRDGERLPQLDPGPLHRRHSICIPSRFHNLGRMPWIGKVRCLGSSAIHLAQVAAGGSVATVIPFWEIWDVGAGVLLIEEAGGRIADLSGIALDPVQRPGTPLVAGAASTLAELRPLFDRISET